jgi:hypothetical protein
VPQAFETNASIAAAMSDLIVTDLPLTWYAGYDERVAAVTAADARAIAEPGWADLSIVVVGDWATLGPGLTSLGLPVVHLDGEGRPVAR